MAMAMAMATRDDGADLSTLDEDERGWVRLALEMQELSATTKTTGSFHAVQQSLMDHSLKLDAANESRTTCSDGALIARSQAMRAERRNLSSKPNHGCCVA